MPSNTAAWLTEKGKPLEVKRATYTSPGVNEILIKNHAIAVNLVDWMLQAMGKDLFPWVTFPAILGGDVAGEVVEVGSGVTNFKVGDRVIGLALGQANIGPSMEAEGGFQTYVILRTNMASIIPDSLSYESAAVLPLGLSTAACGLFQKDHLALQHPTVPPKPTGKTVLVWGGSTSVGSNAVQLAVAAGYEVFSTSSPKNFEHVKKLGASQVFDYKSPTIVADMVDALKGKDFAGAYSLGPDNALIVAEIVAKTDGVKFVSMANPVPSDLPEGITAKFIFGSDLHANEVGQAVFGDFLGKALAEGTYLAAPEAEVVGKGLEDIEKAFEIGKKGVSAKKVVVSL